MHDIEKASRNLDAFVVDQAKQAAHRLGFGWKAVEDAPDTYRKLKAAHQASVTTGAPLPVSSLFCDTIIYSNPEINYALRFWHDTLHVGTGLSFRIDNELELGLHHLELAERAGIRKHSTEWEMLRVDLLGQNYLLGVVNRFPIDQEQFVRDCLTYGLDEGVLMEVRRTQSSAPRNIAA